MDSIFAIFMGLFVYEVRNDQLSREADNFKREKANFCMGALWNCTAPCGVAECHR